MLSRPMPETPAHTGDGPPARDGGTPADLGGLIDFLNSRAGAKRPERFDTPEHAARFLALCDLPFDHHPISIADTRRLRHLRDALMDAVDDPAGSAPWEAVNALTATVAVRVHAEAGPTAGLRAARENPADVVIVGVLDQLLSAITTGRWGRLGACARCRRVFYDNTRSHTRRWCSYATCGNRANVASYRDRRRDRST
jgi:CGNR zinc finger/Putative stress-induced transcription regulator